MKKTKKITNNLIAKLRYKINFGWKSKLSSQLSLTDLRWIVEHKLSQDICFVFNSQHLEYFFHSYNNWGLTERKIEIPIIKHYLSQENYSNVLEIGNVTNHYYDYFRLAFADKRKTVIDKFELAVDIINMDICDYQPECKFDFVFSISTFEHMDADLGRNKSYIPGRCKSITIAADNIKHVLDNLLDVNGKFVVTALLGYTPEWDQTFFSEVFEEMNGTFCRRFVFRKINEINWEQVEISEVKNAFLSSSLPTQQYLSIAEFSK